MNTKKRRMTINLPLRLITSFILLIFLSSCSKDSGTTDDLTGDWKRSSEFDGSARTEAVTFTIDNKVYIGGGYDGTNRLNDFWVFDEALGAWQKIADFPGVARNSAIAFSID